MAKFNSQKLSFRVDLKPPLMRQTTEETRYCIDNLSFSHTKLLLIGDFLAKIISVQFCVDFDSLSQQIESLIDHYKDDYLIKSFRSVIRKDYEYTRGCLVEI